MTPRENGSRVGILVTLLYPLILGLWGFAWLISDRLHSIDGRLIRLETRVQTIDERGRP